MQQHWLALQWHGDLGHLEEDHDTVMAEQKPVVFQESFGGHSSRQCCSFDSSDFLVFSADRQSIGFHSARCVSVIDQQNLDHVFIRH
jgi:hypothetical protein